MFFQHVANVKILLSLCFCYFTVSSLYGLYFGIDSICSVTPQVVLPPVRWQMAHVASSPVPCHPVRPGALPQWWVGLYMTGPLPTSPRPLGLFHSSHVKLFEMSW